jgi:predicted nucleic acid-binding protein
MPQIVVLDSSPLGMVTNPRAKSADCQACKEWLRSMLAQGIVVVVPEIIDYEVRRELIRANRLASIRQLDQLLDLALYLPITTEAMRRAAKLWAAKLWAVVRQTGQPTAHPQALDGDVILAAQTIEAFGDDPGVIVATSNVSHLSRFVASAHWRDIG